MSERWQHSQSFSCSNSANLQNDSLGPKKKKKKAPSEILVGHARKKKYHLHRIEWMSVLGSFIAFWPLECLRKWHCSVGRTNGISFYPRIVDCFVFTPYKQINKYYNLFVAHRQKQHGKCDVNKTNNNNCGPGWKGVSSDTLCKIAILFVLSVQTLTQHGSPCICNTGLLNHFRE